MKSILVILALVVSAQVFAQEQELGVTVITEDQSDAIVATAIKCSSYYTLSALFIEAANTNHSAKTVDLVKQSLMEQAEQSLDIAQQWTLDSQEHTLVPQIKADMDQLIMLLGTDPNAADTELSNRNDSCKTFLTNPLGN